MTKLTELLKDFEDDIPTVNEVVSSWALTLFPIAALTPEQAKSVGIPDVPEVEYYEVRPMKRMTLPQYIEYRKKYGRPDQL